MFDCHLMSEHLFAIVAYEHVFVSGDLDVRAVVHDATTDRRAPDMMPAQGRANER